MAKQHMAQPWRCWMAAGPGPVWLDRDWHQPPSQDTTGVPTLYLSRYRVEGPFYSMESTLVPEQFVFLPFSNLHLCIYNSQQHWGSCSLNTPRIKTKSGTFLSSQSNEGP